MEQELAFTTLAYISNDLLKAVYEKKSDVICNSLPLGCGDIALSYMAIIEDLDVDEILFGKGVEYIL